MNTTINILCFLSLLVFNLRLITDNLYIVSNQLGDGNDYADDDSGEYESPSIADLCIYKVTVFICTNILRVTSLLRLA